MDFAKAAGVGRVLQRLDATPEEPGTDARERIRKALFADVIEEPDAPAPIAAGSVVLDRYVCLDLLGDGGMGQVLRAYDPRLQREVALKIVRPGALVPDAEARLVIEAQAMARLNHPNLVPVYDVGIDAGKRPVIAMGLVDGSSLGEWLEADGSEERTPEAILEKFVQAGRGLAAAHDAGLLHRDFKPSNVLIDRTGRVQVLDFGLARSLDRPSTLPDEPSPSPGPSDKVTREGLTEVGTVLGTPRYMAPEQHAEQPLTAAADQYAFCVALWTALTGTPPFTSRAARLLEDKLSGPPAWPKDKPAPRRVVTAITRGLSPRPEDRWPSMHALLDELTPRARSSWRMLLGLGGLLAVAAAGIVASRDDASPCTDAARHLADDWNEIERHRITAAIAQSDLPWATTTWARIEPRLDGYARDWATHHTAACEATSVHGIQSARVLDLRMACLQQARMRLNAVVQVLADADDAALASAHRLVDQLPPLAACDDVATLEARDSPPSTPAVASRVAEIRERLAQMDAFLIAGKLDEAAAILAEIETEAIDHPPLRAKILNDRGTLLARNGKLEEAEQQFADALQLALAHDVVDVAFAASFQLVQTVGSRLARPREGLLYARIAEGLAARPGAPPHAEVRLRSATAMLLHRAGRSEEALVELEALTYTIASEMDEVRLASHNTRLANVLRSLGRFDDAIAEARTALEAKTRLLGPEHPYTATSRHNLGILLLRIEETDAAEVEIRAALEIQRRTFAPEHPDLLATRNTLGSILLRRGDPEAAAVEYRAVIEQASARLGPQHPTVAAARGNLGGCLSAQADHVGAEAQYREALEARVPPDHAAMLRLDLGNELLAQGRVSEAVDLLVAAVSAGEEMLPVDHPNLQRLRESLADARAALAEQRAAP